MRGAGMNGREGGRGVRRKEGEVRVDSGGKISGFFSVDISIDSSSIP